jgi:hypothetical protein
MKFFGLCGALLAAWLATGSARAQEAAAVKELIPTGKLRFGVAFAPKMSALFVVKDPGGSPRGSRPISASIDPMTTVLIIGASRGIGLETVKLALSEAGKSSMSHGAVSGAPLIAAI